MIPVDLLCRVLVLWVFGSLFQEQCEKLFVSLLACPDDELLQPDTIT